MLVYECKNYLPLRNENTPNFHQKDFKKWFHNIRSIHSILLSVHELNIFFLVKKATQEKRKTKESLNIMN